jgi:hypothetical protein
MISGRLPDFGANVAHTFIMTDPKSISDEQKAQIQSWADEGDDLSAIQKKLADELEIQVTYMEVRFLMGDLGIQMPVKEVPVEEAPVEETPEKAAKKAPEEILATPADEAVAIKEGKEQSAVAEEETDKSGEGEPSAPSVKVTMSDVLPMGAMAGGTVTFSDGAQANWGVDQMGQLSLDPSDPAYRPSEADVQAFQVELQRLAEERRG